VELAVWLMVRLPLVPSAMVPLLLVTRWPMTSVLSFTSKVLPARM
jgi:hypothetical protein